MRYLLIVLLSICLPAVSYGAGKTTSTAVLNQSVFNSAVTVVNKDIPEAGKFGLTVSSLFDKAKQEGLAWRARTYIRLESGETRFFYARTGDDSTEVHLAVRVPSSDFETQYDVYLEPDVSGGSSLHSGNLNPHMEAIGGRGPTYSGVFYEPSAVTSYGTLLPDARERWGQGPKEGGTGPEGFETILSPNQTLGFLFTGYANGDGIRAEWIWYEVDEGVIE